MLLLVAVSLIAIVSVPIVVPLSVRLRALNAQRMAQREHTQELTRLRKAGWKAQLALAELWIAPVERRPGLESDLASDVRDVMRVMDGVLRRPLAVSAQHRFTARLNDAVVAWSQVVAETLPQVGSTKAYERVRSEFQRADQACEDFIADDKRLAREADAAGAIAEQRMGVYNVAIGGAIVVLLGGAIVRLVRDRGRARIEAVEEARRAQASQNEELERRVTERTQELERSNCSLKQSMAELEATQQTLRAKLGELAETRNQLLQAEKLEAVGRLAAGIAHEINTPTQFVGDNVHYLAQSFADILVLVDEYRRIASEVPALRDDASLQARLREVEDNADLEFFRENLEPAIERAKDGISRIAGIVKAMKEFSHPSSEGKETADINRAIQATLTIARNEYKYVADVETDFGELPMLRCYAGDLNQVFLNLIVNAAHAIADIGQEGAARGKIRIRTASDEHSVCIEIADTGCGIPEDIRAKVFEPFFTTKGIGRGTGQGLAIARSIVVDKHGGSLTFESEVGRGTTFRIRLPIESATE